MNEHRPGDVIEATLCGGEWLIVGPGGAALLRAWPGARAVCLGGGLWRLCADGEKA